MDEEALAERQRKKEEKLRKAAEKASARATAPPHPRFWAGVAWPQERGGAPCLRSLWRHAGTAYRTFPKRCCGVVPAAAGGQDRGQEEAQIRAEILRRPLLRFCAALRCLPHASVTTHASPFSSALDCPSFLLPRVCPPSRPLRPANVFAKLMPLGDEFRYSLVGPLLPALILLAADPRHSLALVPLMPATNQCKQTRTLGCVQHRVTGAGRGAGLKSLRRAD